MKSLLYAVLATFLIAVLPACKKDVRPTLIVTVYDTTGVPLENVSVETHPCHPLVGQDYCDTANLNPNFHKIHLTNAAGQATFELPYSSVLDVVGFRALTGPSGDTLDMFYGYTVVSIETKELKKDDKNEYNARLTIDKRVPN